MCLYSSPRRPLAPFAVGFHETAGWAERGELRSRDWRYCVPSSELPHWLSSRPLESDQETADQVSMECFGSFWSSSRVEPGPVSCSVPQSLVRMS